ncbi:MAG: hypothetical protein B5M53_00335 [Candidatus Cloacimonas sp. 4484_209]|nr:MAG: hypothetical protein B5M53_00335 [Candidatus Cloacimonas sp. 4484_209]
MVRINLLPKEEKVKRRAPGISKPVIKMPTGIENYVGIGLVIIVLIIVSVVHIRQKKTISQLNTSIAETRKELRKLDEVVKLVKALDKKRKDLDARIEIIRNLNRGRFEKAKFLYKISSLIPDYCWIEDLGVKGTMVSIKGITFSNQVIAAFMRKLEGEKMFQNIELKNIVGKNVEDHDVMEFELSANIVPETGTPPSSKRVSNVTHKTGGSGK